MGKRILYICITFSLFFCNSQSQTDNPPELFFSNLSTSPARVINFRIYPVSMVFNGNYEYNLKAKSQDEIGGTRYHFINGIFLEGCQTGCTRVISLNVSSGSTNDYGPRHDFVEYKEGAYGVIGAGIYKIEVSDGSSFFDTVTVEYDFGYPGNLSGDVYLIFRNNTNGIGGSGPRVNFQWSGPCSEQNISTVDRKIVAWIHCQGVSRSKEFGSFTYDTLNNNNNTFFPQDSRRDCEYINGYPDENQVFNDNRSGILTLNLTVNKDIHTPDTLIDNPTNIVITPKVFLKISSGKIFNMITPTSPSNGTNHLILDSLSYLFLYSNAKLYINNRNILTLKKNSSVKLFSGSEIRIRQGGLLCNEGADILGGHGKIIYESGHHYINCYSTPDCLLKDSVKFILDSNAILEIPDSTTLHFTGNTTSLIL